MRLIAAAFFGYIVGNACRSALAGLIAGVVLLAAFGEND